MIKVSVVVAVYNAEKYLRQMLESILSQTLNEIEVICVDDGSTDSSLSILKEYEKTDTRISIYVNNIEADGAATARNLGIMHAKGKYISVLDADDYFEPDMLETLYEEAENTSSDLVIYDGFVYDEKIGADRIPDFIIRREFLPDKKTFAPIENANNLFPMTLGAAWNCFFLRSFVENNDIRFQSFHHADDLGFVYLAFACAERITICDKRFIHYRKGRDWVCRRGDKGLYVWKSNPTGCT